MGIIYYLKYTISMSNQIFVTGPTGEKFTLNVEGRDLVKDVQDRIEECVGYECDYLMNGTATLVENMTLDECCISSESAIVVHNDLDGGKRKRKKKVYTKPKKIGHKHKKRPKAVLEYFQVDEAGKVRELKQKTTQGQGWFMADHQDRHVCGATGHTMWRTGTDGKRLPIPKQKARVVVEVVKAAAGGKKKKGKK